MATSEIPLEKLQALLKVDAGGSLYSHLVRVVRSVAEERPRDALLQLESLSRQLKDSDYRGALSPDVTEDPVADAVAKDLRERWCAQSLSLARSPSEPTASKRVLAAVQNFLEDSSMFEWAGVGFGRQESYHIAMSLRQLAADTPSLQRLRLWGKILGTGGDYYVAEGAFKKPADAGPVTVPGTPEYDVEPRSQGANSFTYWVSTGICSPWVRLPDARASHIAAARNVKLIMTGNLTNSLVCSPWFPGTEQHLLRAQIARITASCTLAAKGWYEVDEEAGKNMIKEVENPADSFPTHEELATPAGWTHAAPYLLRTGRSTWPDMEALEGVLSEDAVKAISAQIEEEPEKGMLESIETDLEDMKPEDGPEGSPAWSIKVYGDLGLYTFGDAQKSHRVTAARSLVWPGAVAVAQGARFANLYVGYGLKCGTLVPPQKDSGLPLRGTSPFWPLAPDDIMDEPADIEEQDEPNPQQDEAESDKGDVDPEADE